MGVAALIPGMQYMLTRMQTEIDEMRAMLSIAQNGEPPASPKPVKRAAKPAGMHPRDPNHPKHEAWVRKLRKAQKAAWRVRHREQTA
jgi:hypothetical protein